LVFLPLEKLENPIFVDLRHPCSPQIGRMSILQKSYPTKQHPIDVPFDQVL